MKAVKLMFSGSLLILLGPILGLVDISFGPMFLICWVIGIPLFIAGLFTPAGGTNPGSNADLPQKQCPQCGKHHDFDFPKCPHCHYDYTMQRK